MFRVGNFSFTALQASDQNYNILCKDLKVISNDPKYVLLLARHDSEILKKLINRAI